MRPVPNDRQPRLTRAEGEGAPVPSPCVRACAVDADRQGCTTCGRRLEEIAAWSTMRPEEREATLARVAGPARSDPMRIVALTPSAPAILDAVGALDTLVGISSECRALYPGLEGLPTIGRSGSVRTEDVLGLAPDLVVTSRFGPDVSDLVASHIRVLVLAPWNVAEIHADMRMLASLVGRPHSMECVIQAMQKRMALAAPSTRGLPPRVHSESWMSPHVSSPPWVHELVRKAGGSPVLEPFEVVDDARLAELEPDLVVLAWDRSLTRGAHGRPVRIPKVQIPGTRVVTIRPDWLNVPGPSLAHGFEELVRALAKT